MFYRRITSSLIIAYVLFFVLSCLNYEDIYLQGERQRDKYDINVNFKDVPPSIRTMFEDYNIYSGNNHSHCGYSDGVGTPDQLFYWAKYVDRFDFFFLTDHDTMLINKEWIDIGNVSDQYTEQDVFLAFRGFEWTSGIYGHVNVFDTDTWTTITKSSGIKNLLDWVKKNGGFAMYNHAYWGIANGFDNEKFFEEHVDTVLLFETACYDESNYDNVYFKYYHKFLDKGWKFAPSAGLDSHTLSAVSDLRLGVYAKGLNKVDLLDAIRKKRVYSSDDKNLLLLLKYDTHFMGETVDIGENKEITLTVGVSHNEKILSAKIISNGGEVVAENNNINDINLFWSPTINTIGKTYCFLVVDVENLTDTKMSEIKRGVSSPIFFE